MNAAKGTLFVVATPIGNRDDLSPRARKLLSEVDLVAAEDTRRTGTLLRYFGIEARQTPLHEHNEQDVLAALIAELEQGSSIALVSDAGTPLVSDPGYRLVRMAHERGIRVSPVPGPSAAVAALSAAGLPSDAWCFEGFLPSRQKARRDRLESLRDEPRTMIFYESVHRIKGSVADFAAAFGASRRAFVGRELSKLHEQCVAAALGELEAMLDDGRIPAKGEFVVAVEGREGRAKAPGIDADRLLTELLAVVPGKKAVEIAAAVTGESRNTLYRKMLRLSARGESE
ncbi:MAG: 16S rRNA (cytidine(1402)-2'-O)-methyltransferase [Woeseiaceae bacterium]